MGSYTNTNQIVEVIVNPTKADESNEEINFIASMTEAEHKHIVDVDEVHYVYASLDDEGNKESNVEIEKINNEHIIKITSLQKHKIK